MRVALFLIVALLAAPASAKGIPSSELNIGGIASGATEASVLDKLGEPASRVETGEGTEYHYPGLVVTMAWMDEQAPGRQQRVAALKGTGANACTPKGLCPGMPVSAAAQLYGPTEPVVREAGSFLEYQPAGLSCWLQVAASQGLIQFVAVACQP